MTRPFTPSDAERLAVAPLLRARKPQPFTSDDYDRMAGVRRGTRILVDEDFVALMRQAARHAKRRKVART